MQSKSRNKVEMKVLAFIQNTYIKWLMVLTVMSLIFAMSHLDSVKSWFITGRVMVTVEQETSEIENLDFNEEISYFSDQEDRMLIYRKIAHVIEFFALVMVWINALYKHVSYMKNLIYSGVISFLYAIFDEVHQLFIEGRTGSASDVLIDSIGILIGILAVDVFFRMTKKVVYEDLTN